MEFKHLFFFAAAAAIGLMGCDPYMEDSPGLPDKPTGEVMWSWLPDTIDGVPGIDSNRIVVSAETSDDVFIHLWDFGNGKTSNAAQDTFTYYAEGTYGLSYQGHADGGMIRFQDSVSIERTIDLPCEGTLALLTGCDNPKAWKLSPESGAIAIGPEFGSTEWYSAPQGWQNPTSATDNIDFQTDDRWTLTEDGEFLYNNNGSSMNPFDGYIETPMTVAPSTYTLELDGGIGGEPVFTVNGLTTEAAEICGWMGVWDSGPTYTITELTEDRLVLSALQQGGDCINPVGSGYFTLIFVTE